MHLEISFIGHHSPTVLGAHANSWIGSILQLTTADNEQMVEIHSRAIIASQCASRNGPSVIMIGDVLPDQLLPVHCLCSCHPAR